MIKDLKERWIAEETKIGKFFKTWVTGILAACSALGAANEYLAMVPPDFVPGYVKTSVVIAGVASFVYGKLTKKDAPK